MQAKKIDLGVDPNNSDAVKNLLKEKETKIQILKKNPRIL